VCYLARFEEAVHVLHAFEKRSRQTRQTDIDLAKTRLGLLLRARQGMHGG
jgi:phage-related protein